MEVTGPIEMHLCASSSAVDTDFTAKLIDVYPPSEDHPDGLAINLTDSIIRARYRNGFEAPERLPVTHDYSDRPAEGMTVLCYGYVEVFAEKIRRLVERTRFTFENTDIPITISIGVSTVNPELQHVEDLIRVADEYLYAAKDAGRNRCRG